MSAPASQHAGAVLVCHPDPKASGSAEWTVWADVAEARLAAIELAMPVCGPRCIGVHTVVRVDLEPNPRHWSSLRSRTTATAEDDLSRTEVTAGAAASDGADT